MSAFESKADQAFWRRADLDDVQLGLPRQNEPGGGTGWPSKVCLLLYRDRQRLPLFRYHAIKDLGSFGRTRVLRLMDVLGRIESYFARFQLERLLVLRLEQE